MDGFVDGKLFRLTKKLRAKEGRIVFSKFDFNESANKITTSVSGSKKKSDQPTGRNYKNLIEKVTIQKQKIQLLEKVDKQKAIHLKEKVWNLALTLCFSKMHKNIKNA